MKESKIFVATIEGPTAVGKSNLALKIASYLTSEIISADSRQVYRFLNIGTAKPAKEELEKVQHHLIDIVNPDEEYSAGHFREDAFQICSELSKQDKIPLVVGGTGFYVHSFLNGLASVPTLTNEIKLTTEKDLEQLGNLEFHKKLTEVDPVAAAKIDYQDTHRMLRAMAVYKEFNKPLSSFWDEQLAENKIIPYRILITENRDNLYKKIDQRVDKMLEMGLLNEIQSLIDKGYKENDPGMITVGYREFYPYLKNEISLDKAVELVKQHSRNYAKRQLTWYRKQDFNLTIEANSISFLEIKDKIFKYKSSF